MKDKWLIEEVTSSDNCKYKKALHNDVSGELEYYFCDRLSDGYAIECTKESCPIRVKSDLATYGNPESMQKEIWRLEEKIEKAGLTVREDE